MCAPPMGPTLLTRFFFEVRLNVGSHGELFNHVAEFINFLLESLLRDDIEMLVIIRGGLSLPSY